MATLFVKGEEIDDSWMIVEGDQPIPSDGNIILSLDLFLATPKEKLDDHGAGLGVFLTADEQVDFIVDRLEELNLIALEFPSFADGRAFSKATLLRGKYQYEGQIRAVGDVRIDQVELMKRCGFDALLIRHQPTIDALQSGDDPGLHLYYQPAIGDADLPIAEKAWARRAP